MVDEIVDYVDTRDLLNDPGRKLMVIANFFHNALVKYSPFVSLHKEDPDVKWLRWCCNRTST